jgi:hypothetical protein
MGRISGVLWLLASLTTVAKTLINAADERMLNRKRVSQPAAVLNATPQLQGAKGPI